MSKHGKRQNHAGGQNRRSAQSYVDQLRGRHLTHRDWLSIHAAQFDVVNRVFSSSRILPTRVKYDLGLLRYARSYNELTASCIEWPDRQPRLRRELHWACNVCLLLTDQLNALLAHRRRYFTGLMAGRFAECRDTLNEMRQSFGASLWLLRTQPFVEQYAGGLAGNKTWLKAIEDEKPNPRVKFLAQAFSLLAEETTSAAWFERLMVSLLHDEARPSDPLLDYLYLELVPFGQRNPGALAFYLGAQTTNSLVDLHDGLLRVLVRLSASGILSELPPETIPLVNRLADALDDVRWTLIKTVLDPSTLRKRTDIEQRFLPIFDAYTEGDFRDVRQRSRTCIEDNIADLDVWELYLRAAAPLDEHAVLPGDDPLPLQTGSPVLTMLDQLQSIVVKGPETSRDVQGLRKTAHLLVGHPLSDSIHALCAQQSPASSGGITSRYWDRVRLLSQHGGTPQFALVYDKPNERSTYLAAWKNAYGNHSCLRPFLDPPAEAGCHTQFEVRRLNLYSAERLCAQGHHDRAILLLESIRGERLYSFERERLVKCLLACYREAGMSRAELGLLVDAIIQNPFLLTSVDLQEVHDRLSAAKHHDWAWALDYSILFHWYHLQLPTNRRDDYDLYACYARVIESFPLTSVLDLISSSHAREISLDRLTYFLKNVCSSMTLENDWRFASVKEQDGARIALLDHLTHIDPVCAEEYQREALQLVRNAEIRRLVKAVDESRIFVDTPRIVERLGGTLDDHFRRFRGLRALCPELRQQSSVPVAELKQGDSEPKPATAEQHDDQAFLEFNNLFQDFVKDFLFHDEYGLDHFLSGRIRHGVVDNELRSVFEMCNLVTKRSGDVYLLNEHWGTKCSHLDPGQREKLQVCLATLSGNVDSVITKVKESWVQVAFSPGVIQVTNVSDILQHLRSSRSQGFDFRFTPADIYEFFRACPECAVMDDFAEYVFQIMWKRTETCLAELRGRIEGELKTELLAVIDRFAEDADAVGAGTNPYLKSALAECRSELHRKLAGVAQWFRLSDKYRLDDFTLETVINTCLTILRNRNGEHFRQVVIDCRDIQLFPGETFLSFIDALLLLLGNILKHARDEMASTCIRTSLDDAGKTLLSVSNTLPAGIDAVCLLAKIKKASDRGGLRNEGGTGFVKLQKILRDLSRFAATFEYRVGDGTVEFGIALHHGGGRDENSDHRGR